MATLIGVASGKGGVGKTTTAVNLALALQESRGRTMLMDADLGLANAQLILGESPTFNIKDLLEKEMTLEEICHECAGGLKLIAGASGDPTLANLSLVQTKTIEEVLRNTQLADLVLVDLAAGIATQTVEIFASCDISIVILADEPASIADAYGVLKLQQQRSSLSNTYLVVNRAKSEQHGESLFKKMNHLCMSFLGEPVKSLGSILEHPDVREAHTSRSVLPDRYPNSQAWRNFLKMSKQLSAEFSNLTSFR